MFKSSDAKAHACKVSVVVRTNSAEVLTKSVSFKRGPKNKYFKAVRCPSGMRFGQLLRPAKPTAKIGCELLSQQRELPKKNGDARTYLHRHMKSNQTKLSVAA